MSKYVFGDRTCFIIISAKSPVDCPRIFMALHKVVCLQTIMNLEKYVVLSGSMRMEVCLYKRKEI